MIDPGVEPDPVGGPPLPLGRRVKLPGRGTTFVREIEGPAADAPTVILVHGWIASGGLNWFRAFDDLSEHFRVIAPDHRGHGRGIHDRRRFTIRDVADDIAALAWHLDAPRSIVVGYSMGGPISQTLWRRHPHLVDGLVFSATSHTFGPGRREMLFFASLMAAAAGTTRAARVASQLSLPVGTNVVQWAMGDADVVDPSGYSPRAETLRAWAAAEMRRHRPTAVLEAGLAIGTFTSKRWVHEIDVPTTVLVTTKDRAVPPELQLDLARRIPGARVEKLAGGHAVCGSRHFGKPLADACLGVAGRIESLASA